MRPAIILATALAAGASAPAAAECDTWRVDGELTIRRSDGSTVHTRLAQTGARVSGRAWENPGQSGRTASVDGRVREDGVRLRIAWPRDVQLYEGGIYPGGEIDGVAVAQQTRARVSWQSLQLAQCADW